MYLLSSLVLHKLNQPARSAIILQRTMPSILNIPPARQAECYYWAAKLQLLLDKDLALQNIIDGDKIATDRGMWGWSLKFKAIQANLSPSEANQAAYQTLLRQLCKDMSKEQQSLIEDHLSPENN